MFKITLWHNPRCSKSRQTLELIESRGITPTIVHYLEQKPTAEELRQVLDKLGMEPRDLMRKKDTLYTELRLGDPKLSASKLVQAMLDHPILIERPVAITEKAAAIGRPPQNVLQLLDPIR